MDNDEIYTIDISGLIDYNNTVDMTSISGETIEIHTIGNLPGTVWLNTNENKYYVHDGAEWNLSSTNTVVDVEWSTVFPDFYKIKEMCAEYPALEKAYENFKTIYKMVEQDWVGKNKDDNNPPF